MHLLLFRLPCLLLLAWSLADPWPTLGEERPKSQEHEADISCSWQVRALGIPIGWVSYTAQSNRINLHIKWNRWFERLVFDREVYAERQLGPEGKVRVFYGFYHSKRLRNGRTLEYIREPKASTLTWQDVPQGGDSHRVPLAEGAVDPLEVLEGLQPRVIGRDRYSEGKILLQLGNHPILLNPRWEVVRVPGESCMRMLRGWHGAFEWVAP